MSAHPAWCRIAHQPGQASPGVHSAVIGEVFTDDRSTSVLVELNDLDDGRGPRVTVGVTDEDGFASAALDGARARQVAGALHLGADVLAGRARIRERHSFTVERTNGDHLVWRCRCGFLIVEDPGSTDVHARLTAHAAGPGAPVHAFKLGEPHPAGHVWVCLCGTWLLQRHDDTRDLHARLLAHLRGDPSAQACPSGCGLALGDCLTCPAVTR